MQLLTDLLQKSIVMVIHWYSDTYHTSEWLPNVCATVFKLHFKVNLEEVRTSYSTVVYFWMWCRDWCELILLLLWDQSYSTSNSKWLRTEVSWILSTVSHSGWSICTSSVSIHTSPIVFTVTLASPLKDLTVSDKERKKKKKKLG